MTEEQIKQTSKITEFARNMVKQSNYPIDLQDHIIATCMVVVTEATKELEKENAELKKTVLQFQKDSYCGMCHFKTKAQLTKAKEIIKELVRVEYADFTNGDYSNELSKVLEQAEQFLSEVEK